MRTTPFLCLPLAAALAAAGGCSPPANRPTVVQPPPGPTIEPTPAPRYPPPDGVQVPVEHGPLPPSQNPAGPEAAMTTTAAATTTTTPGPLVIGTPAPPRPNPPPDPVIDPYSAVTAVPGGVRPGRVTTHGVVLPGAGRPTHVPPPPAVVGHAASRLILSNDSGLTVCRLWLSPTADGAWGNELLGGLLLPPGSELAVSVDPSWPAWDVLAQDCSGLTLHEQRGRPLPSDGVWSIRPAATAAPVTPGPPPPTVVY